MWQSPRRLVLCADQKFGIHPRYSSTKPLVCKPTLPRHTHVVCATSTPPPPSPPPSPPTPQPPRRPPAWASVDEELYTHTTIGTNTKLDRDEIKESARVHFRTVFDFQRWAAHRSTRRYVRHAVGIFQSRMLKGLAPPLLFVALLSTAIALGHELVDNDVIAVPSGIRTLFIINSSLPLTLTSTVLGLLLVFRTNASYARWLDARKSWGVLVNRSRDLVRQGLTWIPDDSLEGMALRSMLCRWVIVMAYALKCHVREGEDAAQEVAVMKLLPDEELRSFSSAVHRPVYAMQVLSMVVQHMSYTVPHCGPAVGNMDLNLTALEDVTGTCERILKTPIPLSYTRHTSRFMMCWLSALPFALWEPCRWGVVPIATIISLLVLGVEEIGVNIEEPFSILPLEQICGTVKSNVEEMERCVCSSPSSSQVAAMLAGGDDGKCAMMLPASLLVDRAVRFSSRGGSGSGGGEDAKKKDQRSTNGAN